MFWNNILQTKIELVSLMESYFQPFFETIKLQIIVSHIYSKSTPDCMETTLCLGFRLSIRFGQEYFSKINISVNISELSPCSHC